MSTPLELIREFQQLQGNRGTLESHWQEIAERMLPAYMGTFNSNSSRTSGDKRNENILDSTAVVALGRFASVVDSLLTPMNQKWQKLTTNNEDLNKSRNVKLWFEAATNILFKYRYSPTANFASQNNEVWQSLGGFGTGCLFTDQLDSAAGLRYKSVPLGEIYFKENHQGIIDQAYRFFSYKAHQIMKRWPDQASAKVREAYAKGSEDDFWILHVVKPRENYDPQRLDAKGKKFHSCYIDYAEKTEFEDKGYNSFPYGISRYRQAPREVYGRGPGMDVLPAVKTLNEQKRIVLKQGHRIVDPVLLLPDDGVIDSFSLRNGALNYGGVNSQGQPLVHTLPSGKIAVGKELMDDERMVVNDAFLVSLFQILVESPQMTATEVLERVKEKGMLIAPTVGRQQSEYLGPNTDRELDLLMMQGLLPEMPGELIEAKGEYHIEYLGPMARAMRSEEASGALRSIESTLQMVNVTQDPEPLDWYDMDVIVPETADINGTPLRWMRDWDAVQKRREDRAQKMEQQQAIDAAPAAAGLIKATQGNAKAAA